ncbi:hypothetical protein ASPCAL09022 [Aspergillus calidoustus]|uniref:Anaphase-promoting complex subunit 4-like WD40 domain-containing protein n=1 Tax=Aspergillus calidoustus TaxID=454130 RepID=A0A0U5GY39_ASPCI|nr:hypothetical protein ASPCAL09022 [Aspergillus calidoustus]
MPNTLSGTKRKRKRSSSPPRISFESIPLEPHPSKSNLRQATCNKSTIHDRISREPISPEPTPFESISGTPTVREHSPEPAPASLWVPTHIHKIGPHTPRIELEQPASKMTLTHDDKYLAVVVGEKELRLYDTSNFELVSTLQVPEPCSGYKEILFAPLLMENSGYMLVTVTGRMGVYDFNPRVKVPVPRVTVPLDDTESEGSSAGSDEGSLDKRHKSQDVRTTSAMSTMACITEHQFNVLGWNVGFSPDGTFMVYTTLRAKERRVCIWDVKQRRTRKIVNPELKRPKVTICPNSDLIATGGLHGLLHIWKAANGDCVSVFKMAEKDKVLNVIFSPDSKWLAVHDRKGESLHRIYDIATGQTIFSVSNSYSPRAWSIGGNLLAASSVTGHREIVLVDGITGTERVRWDLGDEEGGEKKRKKGRPKFLRQYSSEHLRFLDHGSKLVVCTANGRLDLYDFLSFAKHRYQGWRSSNALLFSNNHRGFVLSDHENKALIFQDFE